MSDFPDVYVGLTPTSSTDMTLVPLTVSSTEKGVNRWTRQNGHLCDGGIQTVRYTPVVESDLPDSGIHTAASFHDEVEEPIHFMPGFKAQPAREDDGIESGDFSYLIGDDPDPPHVPVEHDVDWDSFLLFKAALQAIVDAPAEDARALAQEFLDDLR